MAGLQDFQAKTDDIEMTLADPETFHEEDAEKAGPQDFKAKAKDIEMDLADPKIFHEEDGDVEEAGPPRYVCVLPAVVDIERAVPADDIPIQHNWLCDGGDPAECGCPRPTSRFDRFLWKLNLWQTVVLFYVVVALWLAALLFLVYSISVWAAGVVEDGDAQAQAVNCTSFFASDQVGCVNGTKLD
jgi:hypothetical protein